MLSKYLTSSHLIYVYIILNVLIIKRYTCRTIDWRKLTTGYTFRTVSLMEHPFRTDFYDMHNDWLLQYYKRGPYCTYCTCARCNTTTDNSWRHSHSQEIEKMKQFTPPKRYNRKTPWKDPMEYGYDSDDIKDNKTTMFKFPRFMY
uniref:Uncharacterized protein n=1 Tax=Cacopsylla melanoneura TaxID=428564 RepID=A0A8D8QHR3_9HEMI